jgi:hypothetical protein
MGDIEDSDLLKVIELHCEELARLNNVPNQSLEPTAAATASSK